MTIIMVIERDCGPLSLVYDPEVKQHLRAVAPEFRSLIRTTIEEQLRFEPDRGTRTRKPLQRPVAFEATWELRFGPENRYRVFYAVDHERAEVQILAIGIKERARLIIGGEEIKI